MCIKIRGDCVQLAFFNTNLTKESRRKAEKLMSSYKNIEAIIESKKLDLEPRMTANYQASESQRGNQFHSETERLAIANQEIEEYVITRRKLSLVYESLKKEQQEIWEQRYIQGKYDTDVYSDMGLNEKRYYRLKGEMIAVVADALNLI
nr:ArpU family phage packaging/lysis transcriptional regulator [Lederbergia citrisecunda]